MRSAIPVPERSWTRLPVIRTWPGGAVKPPAATTIPSVPAGASPVPSRLTAFESTVASAPTTIPSPLVAILLLTTSSVPPGATIPVATTPPCSPASTSLPSTRHEYRYADRPPRSIPRSKPDDDVVLDAQAGREQADVVAAGRVDPLSGRRGRCGGARAAARRPRARPPSRCRPPTSRRRGRRAPGASSSRSCADAPPRPPRRRSRSPGSRRSARSPAVRVSAVPRATRIVAGPWPLMRTERAPSALTPFATS